MAEDRIGTTIRNATTIQIANNGSRRQIHHLSSSIAPSLLTPKMPYIHPTCTDNATALLQQALQRTKRPPTGNPLHVMDLSPLKALSLRDELRLHARYIRDTLAPLLSRQSGLTHSDRVLLRSIFQKLESTDITLDLLRYSRVEKALMVIAATGASRWWAFLELLSHPLTTSILESRC